MDAKLLLILASLALVQAFADEELHKPIRLTPSNALLGAAEQSPRSGLTIAKGHVATPGQFPHQVAIYMDMTDFCGGSVISEQWVLTAARCVDGFRRFVVFLNAFNMLLPKETNRAVMASAESIVHDSYDESTFLNDIGLIRLRRAISADGVRPVKLPALSAAQPTAGSSTQLSGWGATAEGSTVISPELNYAELEIIAPEDCAKTYGYKIITDEKLCAKNATTVEGPCKGDTGGPLVTVDSPDTFTQIGIASFVSNKGCDSGAPAGFVRVSAFLDWINTKTGIVISA